jgi:L-seryl-tRNA(Ser) seleniumtransferase
MRGVEPPSDALRTLPRIDVLLDAAGDLVDRYGRKTVAGAFRTMVQDARERVAQGEPTPPVAALVDAVRHSLAATYPGPPRPVINASGVIIHTNLGRAPLSDAARRAVQDAAGYCTVEYDVATGERGSRNAQLQPILRGATGAEAGIAVNNAAAALVLALTALAAGRQVLISRGELVEIGGSFRLPEVMHTAGVSILEVGTTNRTRAEDYLAGDDVALILKVHPSNYRIAGFTEAASVSQLAEVARERGVPLLHDVGSGLLQARAEPWFADEPTVADSLRSGADLVVCSGDKLLGGPQAGLLMGRADLVATCARHPLARALRLDKLRLAALIATLTAHVRGSLADLPVWRALLADTHQLEERAAALATATRGEVTAGESVVGGGAAPEQTIPSPVVRIACPSPNAVAAALRRGDLPVVVRVTDDAIVVDLRTVADDCDEALARRLAAVLDTFRD